MPRWGKERIWVKPNFPPFLFLSGIASRPGIAGSKCSLFPGESRFVSQLPLKPLLFQFLSTPHVPVPPRGACGGSAAGKAAFPVGEGPGEQREPPADPGLAVFSHREPDRGNSCGAAAGSGMQSRAGETHPGPIPARGPATRPSVTGPIPPSAQHGGPGATRVSPSSTAFS